jgi:hypothetical protein
VLLLILYFVALEKKLRVRPERDDLADRNILKDTSASPLLQAAQAQVEKGLKAEHLEKKVFVKLAKYC